ncbi:MAG: energy transducer TonB [Deltaproteobacteria bacterium]|nr:energy transducer TonB [Deltaproteobacteria bacterium]
MGQQISSFVDSSLQVMVIPSLPHHRSPRRYGSAWIISGIVHGLLIVVGLWGGTQILDAPRPTIRLVFVEPPPPSPVSVGAPVSETVLPTPQQLPPVVEKPKEQGQPKPTKPKEPERLTIVKKKKPREEPKPRQPEPPVPQPAEAAPEPMPVVTAGGTSGKSNGVIGGVTGGQTSGVIGGQGTEPLPVSQVANPPLLLSREMPTYPRQARVRGVEGLVLLEAILDPEGRIENNIKVLQSIPSLDHAAVEALRRWRFRPARDRDNQPVRVVLEVPVRFVLK